MAKLLSTTSDPIRSAVDTFSTLYDTLDVSGERAQKKELTGLQLQQAQMALSQEKQRQAAIDDLIVKNAKAQEGMGGAPYGDIARIDKDLPGALEESRKGAQEVRVPSFTKGQSDAIITAAVNSHFISNDPKDWAKQGEAANYIASFIDNAKGKFQPGSKTVITGDKAPQLIDSLNTMYGKAVDTGTDYRGYSVEKGEINKKISGVYIDMTDPKNPMASFQVEFTMPEKYTPKAADYDIAGAKKAGLTADPKTGHMPDT